MTATSGAVTATAAVAGLFVGSFLNVVVHRVPLGRSVVSPRSSCPGCARQLTWWENIPLLSWLALRGRCRTCHAPISVRYPAVEAATALAFTLVAVALGPDVTVAGYCILAATATAIAAMELDGNRAPLSVAALGAGIGAAVIVASGLLDGHPASAAGCLAGAAGGALAFGLLRAADPSCRDPRWFGRTDLIVAGTWLGGLGGRAAVGGVAAWVVASAACLLVVRLRRRTAPGRSVPRPFGLPLVVGLSAAMAASLAVAH